MMNRYFLWLKNALGIVTLGLSLILFDSTVSAATLTLKLKYSTINNWEFVQEDYGFDLFDLEETYSERNINNNFSHKYQINNSPQKFHNDNQNDSDKQKLDLENSVPLLPQVKEYSKVGEGLYYFETDLSNPNLEADNLNNEANLSSNQVIEVEDIISGKNYSSNSQDKKVNFLQRFSDYSAVPGIADKNPGSSLKTSLSDATSQIRNFRFNIGLMNLLKKVTGVNQNQSTPTLRQTSYFNTIRTAQSDTNYTYKIPSSKLQQQLRQQLQQQQKKEKKERQQRQKQIQKQIEQQKKRQKQIQKQLQAKQRKQQQQLIKQSSQRQQQLKKNLQQQIKER